MKKIKTIKIFYLDVDSQDGDDFLSSYSEFDEKGHLKLSVDYMAEDEMESKSVFEYTPEGKLAKEIRFLSEDEVAESHIFDRDADGRIQRVTIEYADQSQSIKQYTYSNGFLSIEVDTTDDEGVFEERETTALDAAGNILCNALYGAGHELKHKFVNEYNEKNQVVRRQEYDDKGELRVEYRYTYTEDGELLRRTGVSKKGNLLNDVHYLYDSQGRILEVFMKNSYLTKYIYDDENRTKTEETYNQSGMLDSREVVTYDEDGRVISEEKVHHTLRYEYEFYE